MSGHVGAIVHRWTQAELEMVRTRWLDGKTAEAIAQELGQGITKNSVISRVHSLNLGSHRSTPVKRRPKQRFISPKAPVSVPRAVTPAVDRPAPLAPFRPGKPVEVILDEGPLVALVDLGNHSCRWPIGDPLLPDFGFCWQPIVDGKSMSDGERYCAKHKRRASP